MIYINTIGGYYYKKYQNGKKKRISKAEFLKKLKNGGGNGCSIPESIKPQKIQHQFVIPNNLSFYIGELLQTSLKIYQYILSKIGENVCTLVCGGQSPAYFCLAMQHLPDFKSDKIKIVILPFSKGGQPLSEKNITDYCTILQNHYISFVKYVYILDFIDTGVGINALASTLEKYDKKIIIKKLALLKAKKEKVFIENHYREDGCPIDYLSYLTSPEIPIPIDIHQEFYNPSISIFSDNLPRIVDRFLPDDFSLDFCPYFKLENNLFAVMIIELAKKYKDIESIQQNDWYKLNSSI